MHRSECVSFVDQNSAESNLNENKTTPYPRTQRTRDGKPPNSGQTNFHATIKMIFTENWKWKKTHFDGPTECVSERRFLNAGNT